MEVLKPGIKKGDPRYEVTCARCEAEIAFRESEGYVFSSSGGDEYVQISCPECDYAITTRRKKGK